MKVVNRTEFLSLPAGTVFCKYESMGCFGGLRIKEDSLQNDWYYSELMAVGVFNTDEFLDTFSKLESSSNYEIPVDSTTVGRDGLYEMDARYAVLDSDDVFGIIQALQDAVSLAEANTTLPNNPLRIKPHRQGR